MARTFPLVNIIQKAARIKSNLISGEDGSDLARHALDELQQSPCRLVRFTPSLLPVSERSCGDPVGFSELNLGHPERHAHDADGVGASFPSILFVFSMKIDGWSYP